MYVWCRCALLCDVCVICVFYVCVYVCVWFGVMSAGIHVGYAYVCGIGVLLCVMFVWHVCFTSVCVFFICNA